MIVFAVVIAFFLLMEYFNTRKGAHLMWAIALIITYIPFHQVANTGTYTWLLEGWGTGFLIMIPALIASGILLTTFSDKPIIAQLFLLVMAIVAIFVGILGLPNITSSLNVQTFVRLGITAVAAVTSIGVMLIVPIYTTLISKETTAKAYFMVGAAALLLIWLIGFAISMTLVKEFVDMYNASPAAAFNGDIENIGLFFTFGLFPYIFIFSMAFAVLGVMYEPSWKFTIPGVDVEDETRIEKLTIQKKMPLLTSALVIAGGVVTLIGGSLAGWINISQEIINAVTIGILLIGGLLAALLGAAVLMSWEPEIKGRQIGNYLSIALGAITLIFAIILMLLPVVGDLMALPAIPVFLLPEGQIWIILAILLIFLGPILILAGGILSEFVFKE
jgi:hypothetical protein